MLLSSTDRDAVARRFADVTHPVTLLFFTQTIGAPESAFLAKQVLDEMASLSEWVTVEELSFVLDKDRAAQYGIEDIPAIVLLRAGEDARLRFLGAPSGYEVASLVDAIVLAGTDSSGLSPESHSLLTEQITTPIEIRVFTTPSCAYCPRAVTLAHRIATASPHVRATCIDASDLHHLARRYHVTGVPKTVISAADREPVEILGAVPEDELIRALLPPPPTPTA